MGQWIMSNTLRTCDGAGGGDDVRGRNAMVNVTTLIAAVAAVVMFAAGIMGEAINLRLIPQLSANHVRAVCQAAPDVTLPLRMQTELQGQCAEQAEP
jgi:hypothetical protein